MLKFPMRLFVILETSLRNSIHLFNFLQIFNWSSYWNYCRKKFKYKNWMFGTYIKKEGDFKSLIVEIPLCSSFSWADKVYVIINQLELLQWKLIFSICASNCKVLTFERLCQWSNAEFEWEQVLIDNALRINEKLNWQNFLIFYPVQNPYTIGRKVNSTAKFPDINNVFFWGSLGKKLYYCKKDKKRVNFL